MRVSYETPQDSAGIYKSHDEVKRDKKGNSHAIEDLLGAF